MKPIDTEIFQIQKQCLDRLNKQTEHMYWWIDECDELLSLLSDELTNIEDDPSHIEKLGTGDFYRI